MTPSLAKPWHIDVLPHLRPDVDLGNNPQARLFEQLR